MAMTFGRNMSKGVKASATVAKAGAVTLAGAAAAAITCLVKWDDITGDDESTVVLANQQDEEEDDDVEEVSVEQEEALSASLLLHFGNLGIPFAPPPVASVDDTANLAFGNKDNLDDLFAAWNEFRYETWPNMNEDETHRSFDDFLQRFGELLRSDATNLVNIYPRIDELDFTDDQKQKMERIANDVTILGIANDVTGPEETGEEVVALVTETSVTEVSVNSDVLGMTLEELLEMQLEHGSFGSDSGSTTEEVAVEVEAVLVVNDDLEDEEPQLVNRDYLEGLQEHGLEWFSLMEEHGF